MTFSQRRKIKQIKKKMQIDSIDSELRNSLWGVFFEFYLEDGVDNIYNPHGKYYDLFSKLWRDFFKLPSDEVLSKWVMHDISNLKNIFFRLSWNEVYDFIEFVSRNINTIKNGTEITDFIISCNKMLERELSGYRIVNQSIIEISSELEIDEIEKASQSPVKSINEHLNRSLELLSDKENPDYRNSIKESISAVESICKKITGKKSSTLGESLIEIRKRTKIDLHPALNNVFLKLYGYTSADNGIRHGLMEKSNLTFDEAKFFLVSCSAFVNYLIALSSKQGIVLK